MAHALRCVHGRLSCLAAAFIASGSACPASRQNDNLSPRLSVRVGLYHLANDWVRNGTATVLSDGGDAGSPLEWPMACGQKSMKRTVKETLSLFHKAQAISMREGNEHVLANQVRGFEHHIITLAMAAWPPQSTGKRQDPQSANLCSPGPAASAAAAGFRVSSTAFLGMHLTLGSSTARRGTGVL
ncbi:hypothetical protein BST61_g10745 [Cercospora zeina]